MLDHLVIFRFRPLSDEESAQMIAEVNSLKKIEGVLDLSFGTNFSSRSAGYTHGLLVRLADKAGLQAYLEHPDHIR